MHRLLHDEYAQILVFVCAPLVAFLIVIIAALARGRRNIATFPNFSVTILNVDREEAYVVYREGAKKIEFFASIQQSMWERRRVLLEAPIELADDELQRVIPNLQTGFKKLGVGYSIYSNNGTLISSDQPARA